MKTTFTLFQSLVLFVSAAAGQGIRPGSNTITPLNPESKHILLPPGVSRANVQTISARETENATPQFLSDFPQGHGITYYGGPVMTGTVNLYLIWYGNWSGNPAVPLVTDFMSALSGSGYYGIDRSYYDDTAAGDGSYSRISGAVSIAGTWYDNYSQGANNPSIIQVVQDAINGQYLPQDTNGVYFMFTSPDVSLSGYGTAYCGYHGSFDINGTEQLLTYALIGPGSSVCTVQPDNSPNDNPQGDALVNIIAHELSESVTDRDIGWYNLQLGEMGDMCAWKFGSEQTASNGSSYNVTLGGRNYLLQQLWVNDGPGYCSLQWPAPVPSNQWFNIIPATNSNLCVYVPTWPGDGNGQQPGTQLQLWYCWNGPMQKFMFTPVPGGYAITVQDSGQQWDVQGGPGAVGKGVPVQQWPYWGGSNEVWEVSDPDANGYVTISALSSARILDAVSIPATNYAQNAGALLQQWDYWGGPNQLWKLVPAQ